MKRIINQSLIKIPAHEAAKAATPILAAVSAALILTVLGAQDLHQTTEGWYDQTVASGFAILALTFAFPLSTHRVRKSIHLSTLALIAILAVMTSLFTTAADGSILAGGIPMMIGALYAAAVFTLDLARIYVFFTSAIALLTSLALHPVIWNSHETFQHAFSFLILITSGVLVATLMSHFVSNFAQVVERLEDLRAEQSSQAASVAQQLQPIINGMNSLDAIEDSKSALAGIRVHRQALKELSDNLDSSGFQLREVEINDQHFSPQKLLNEIASELKPMLRENNAELTLNSTTAPVMSYLSDPALLRTTISNIVRFMAEDKSTSNIRISTHYQYATQELNVCVENDADQQLITFEGLLTQQHDVRLRRTGYDLEYSRGWLAQIGARLILSRSPLGGVRAAIKIPTLEYGQVSRFSTDTPIRATRKILSDQKILIVDDNQTEHGLNTQMLTRHFSCHVSHANDGAEALEMMVEDNYQLIICKYELPVFDGRQLATALRMTGNKTPLILTTHVTRPKTLTHLRLAGALAVLPLPLDISALARAFVSGNETVSAMNQRKTNGEERQIRWREQGIAY